MRLIRGLNRVPENAGCVATIGNFDGVHLGHQAILAQLQQNAQQLHLPACVISFEPLPHEYFSARFADCSAPITASDRLHGLRNRVQTLRQHKVDWLLLLAFNDTLAQQSAQGFIQHTLIDTLKIRHLIVGDDFRFGHQRSGDFEQLQQAGKAAGFTVEQNATVADGGLRISSTRVREHLQSAELAKAKRLLGRHYRISGRVMHGEKVGRQLGFPTANVALKQHRPPLRGVFAVKVIDQDTGATFNGVANLGERPTVGGRKLLLEVHMLDAEAELYGHHLHVDFIHFLRGEQKFGSLDELKAAIANDAEDARRLLN